MNTQLKLCSSLLALMLLMPLLGCSSRSVGDEWEIAYFQGRLPTFWYDGQTLWIHSLCHGPLRSVDPRRPELHVERASHHTSSSDLLVGCPDGTAHLLGSNSLRFDGRRWQADDSFRGSATAGACGPGGAYVVNGRQALYRYERGKWNVFWYEPKLLYELKAVTMFCEGADCTTLVGGYPRSFRVTSSGLTPITTLEGEAVHKLRTLEDGPRSRVFATIPGATLELVQGTWTKRAYPMPLALHEGRRWTWDEEMVETLHNGESRRWGLALQKTPKYRIRTISAALITPDGWLWIAGSDVSATSGQMLHSVCGEGFAERAFVARRAIDNY